MSEYQSYITAAWDTAKQLPKWEIVGNAIKHATDSAPLPQKGRTESKKYLTAIEKFRAHSLTLM